MAKNTRGGLGRGLSSLLNSGNDVTTPRTKEREKIIYNENEDFDYSDQDAQLSGKTGNFAPVVKAAPSRVQATNQQTGKIPPVQVPEKENVSRETITTQTVPTPTSPQKETPVQKEKQPVEEAINEVDIDLISPNPDQPRTNFQQDELDELAKSIKKDGLIQPILVREVEDGKYQIIAGERRWQASKIAGISKVPIQVKNVDDDKALELALIENIQRSDLNPIEEAYGYRRLMERRKMTQADIAQAVSKGRSTIANALRLLELPEEAQQLLFENKITAGHARAILSVPTKDARESLTSKIIEKKLSVRETESLARLLSNKPGDKTVKREAQPALYKSVAKALKDVLKTNVKVKSSKGKNKIEIEFKDERDLERLFEEIVGEEE